MQRPAEPTSAESRSDATTRVAVCAATCRRPDGLQQLLAGLSALQFPEAPPAVTIIIVDNDPAGSARQQIESLRDQTVWPITYVHEPTSGIPFARNAALDAVPVDTDFACFIDDDEVPQPNWLHELMRVQHAEQADVVTGPVVADYAPEVPEWVIRGGFFVRDRHPTGTKLAHAYTGNVLFCASLLRDLNLRFDERFSGNIGEDKAFFRQACNAGRRIVWADDAEVSETVPGSRATAGYLVRRLYEVGRSTTTIELMYNPRIKVWPMQAAKGLVWIALGIVTLPAGLFARRWAVHALRRSMYGVGLLHGMVQPR